jgi:pimeloyl-ACP methyl ester carboxylesterase
MQGFPRCAPPGDDATIGERVSEPSTPRYRMQVVLVPGFTLDLRMGNDQCALVAARQRVICSDARAFGPSAPYGKALYSVQTDPR